MGRIEKKVEEKRKSEKELTTKLITDLIWYCDSMNKVIRTFVDEANTLNGIINQSLKEFKEGGKNDVLQ